MNKLIGNNLKINGLGGSDNKNGTGSNDDKIANIRPQEINLVGEYFNIKGDGK